MANSILLVMRDELAARKIVHDFAEADAWATEVCGGSLGPVDAFDHTDGERYLGTFEATATRSAAGTPCVRFVPFVDGGSPIRGIRELRACIDADGDVVLPPTEGQRIATLRWALEAALEALDPDGMGSTWECGNVHVSAAWAAEINVAINGARHALKVTA